jgi:hypothetical protein
LAQDRLGVDTAKNLTTQNTEPAAFQIETDDRACV